MIVYTMSDDWDFDEVPWDERVQRVEEKHGKELKANAKRVAKRFKAVANKFVSRIVPLLNFDNTPCLALQSRPSTLSDMFFY